MDDVYGCWEKDSGKGGVLRCRELINRGTLTRKMDYAAVKTEGAIKFRPHRSTDLLCSVFLFCQFYIRSFALFASIHLFERNWTGLSEKSTDTIFI